MFRPGRILQMGGASSAALVIDINGATPVVTATQSMSSQRQWVSATVLPDGRVLATGGSAVDNALTNVNNSAEVWDPNGNGGTGKWTVGPSGVNARLYHSGALLLPDARVMIVGGGAPGPLVNTNIEMYTPSYLLDPNGNPMPRPSITTALTSVEVGQSFSVGYSSPSSISRVTLVKTGSITHSVNMDQRFIELGFTANGAMLDVNGPVRATDTPPGYYLLFILNSQGVPRSARSYASVSRRIPTRLQTRRRSSAAPAARPSPSRVTRTKYSPASTARLTARTSTRRDCNASRSTRTVTGSARRSIAESLASRAARAIPRPARRTMPSAATAGVPVPLPINSTSNAALSPRSASSPVWGSSWAQWAAAAALRRALTTAVRTIRSTRWSAGPAAGSTTSACSAARRRLTTVNSPPTIVNPGTLSGTVGVPRRHRYRRVRSRRPGDHLQRLRSADGLSINANTGRITGTPTVPAASSFRSP